MFHHGFGTNFYPVSPVLLCVLGGGGLIFSVANLGRFGSRRPICVSDQGMTLCIKHKTRI